MLMSEYLTLPFSEIDDILQSASELIQSDGENFTDVEFLFLQNEIVVPFALSNMLYMKISYLGSKGLSAKPFHILRTLGKEVKFCCLIAFCPKDNMDTLKNELEKISLFRQKTVFSKRNINSRHKPLWICICCSFIVRQYSF